MMNKIKYFFIAFSALLIGGGVIATVTNVGAGNVLAATHQ